VSQLSKVPWEDLRVRQTVSVTSTTDVMLGTIVRLERKPMIWIAWGDGNHSEYHQAVLTNVTLLDGLGEAKEFDFDQIAADKLVPDIEGE